MEEMLAAEESGKFVYSSDDQPQGGEVVEQTEASECHMYLSLCCFLDIFMGICSRLRNHCTENLYLDLQETSRKLQWFKLNWRKMLFCTL